jgi:hypothetical protein
MLLGAVVILCVTYAGAMGLLVVGNLYGYKLIMLMADPHPTFAPHSGPIPIWSSGPTVVSWWQMWQDPYSLVFLFGTAIGWVWWIVRCYRKYSHELTAHNNASPVS